MKGKQLALTGAGARRVGVSTVEAVEMIANLLVWTDGTEARQWPRHGLHVALFRLHVVLLAKELRQTYVAFLSVCLTELERPSRNVP